VVVVQYSLELKENTGPMPRNGSASSPAGRGGLGTEKNKRGFNDCYAPQVLAATGLFNGDAKEFPAE